MPPPRVPAPADGAAPTRASEPVPLPRRLPEPEVLVRAVRHLEEGTRLAGEERLTEALAHLGEAARLAPTWDLARLRLAQVHRRLGSPPEEILSLLEPVGLAGTSNPQVHYLLGLAYEDAGRQEAAVESYRKAVGLRDDITHAHVRLGILLLGRGTLDEARHHLALAVRQEPDNVVANHHLATVLEGLGEHAEARERLVHLCRLDPVTPFPHLALAAFDRRHGNEAGARAAEREAERRRQKMVGRRKPMRPLR